MKIKENKVYKVLDSEDYKYLFNKKNGYFARWGKTYNEDPLFATAPELLDIEISAGNVGTKEQECLGKCPFCYKANDKGDKPIHNMTLDEFKIILSKMKKVNDSHILTQIAFGIMNIYTNPDFFNMMEYARSQEVIPNYTTHGLDVDDFAVRKTKELCGAVAVSIVQKEKSYDAVKKFTDAGMNQVNFHFMLSEESYEKAFKIIDDIESDKRLERLNAIVFLQYKDKNPNSPYHSVLSVEMYKDLIKYCEEKKVAYGFDSCSAPLYMECIKGQPNEKKLEQYCESCESGIFSSYINCFCEFYPCSFSEGVGDWQEGIDVLNCNNFTDDVWNNERVIEWRNNLINSMENNCRKCLMYSLEYVKE